MVAAPDFLSAYKGILSSAENYGTNFGKLAKGSKLNTNYLPYKGLYTGFQPQRGVDLNTYGGSKAFEIAANNPDFYKFAIGTEPPFVAEKPKTGEFKPETTSPTEDFLAAITDPRFKSFRDEEEQRTDRSNLKQAIYAQQMFQSYIPAMERLAKQTRLTDYQLGLMADIQSPTRQQARASAGQQQMATATGAEAAMLSAVNDAAYKNAMANIAGLQSGMRRG